VVKTGLRKKDNPDHYWSHVGGKKGFSKVDVFPPVKKGLVGEGSDGGFLKKVSKRSEGQEGGWTSLTGGKL